MPGSLSSDQARDRAHRRLIVTAVGIVLLGVPAFVLSWQPWGWWVVLVMVVIDAGLLLAQARGNRVDRKRTIYGPPPAARRDARD